MYTQNLALGSTTITTSLCFFLNSPAIGNGSIRFRSDRIGLNGSVVRFKFQFFKRFDFNWFEFGTLEPVWFGSV